MIRPEGVVTTERLTSLTNPTEGIVKVTFRVAAVKADTTTLQTVALAIGCPTPSVTETVTWSAAPGATMLVGTLADAKSTVVGTYKYPRLNPKASLARSTSKLGFDHHVSVPNPP